jgi:hypothetical protein
VDKQRILFQIIHYKLFIKVFLLQKNFKSQELYVARIQILHNAQDKL